MIKEVLKGFALKPASGRDHTLTFQPGVGVLRQQSSQRIVRGISVKSVCE